MFDNSGNDVPPPGPVFERSPYVEDPTFTYGLRDPNGRWYTVTVEREPTPRAYLFTIRQVEDPANDIPPPIDILHRESFIPWRGQLLVGEMIYLSFREMIAGAVKAIVIGGSVDGWGLIERPLCTWELAALDEDGELRNLDWFEFEKL